MLQTKFKRSLALVLTLCMVVAMMPMTGVAREYVPGDQIVTDSKEPPTSIPGAVWVLTDSVECKKIVHTHEEKCYYQSCDHSDGHLSTCYSESTAYTLCEHEDETQHAGSVTLTDVVEINGTNVSWKSEHPAYSTVYAVYKKAYDDAYASAKWFKEATAKAAGVAALVGKTFCYTTSASAEPDKCTHGECSDYTGDCFSKICVLEEHIHDASCFKYTWTLKTDMNNNGVADDADTYYTVKYVSDGEVMYEKAVLVGMPTPTVENPTKEADAQYTYEFAGWDTPVAEAVTEDVVYTAVYTNLVNKYTVTWVDEDGTELEVDTDVEYGKMPFYDGELPSKYGDNTVVYTFAGWTPSVDAVTGDVTYTATYTSKSVFAVQFFIDGELQKTEYVVDGEQVAEYAPIRKHYELTSWMNGNEEYDFTNAVTANMELHASWKLVDCFVNVQSDDADCTGSGVYGVGDEVVVFAVPKEGYAVTNILVNGEPIAMSYDGGCATATFTTNANTEDYLVEVKTQKTKLVLQSAEMNVFGDLSAESIFGAIYVKGESYPVLKSSDVKVEYRAFSITLFNKTYEWWVEPGTDVSLEKFLEQYGLSALASYIPTETLPHAFGAQSTERVRVSYAGSDKFRAISAETTVALIDLRTTTEITLNQNIQVTYGASAEDVLKAIFKSVNAGETVVTENCQDVTIQMDSLNAGTRKAVISFNGNDEYAASVAEVEVTINKAAGKLDVESYTGKFGTDVNASELFSSDANRIELAMGIFMGNDISTDAGTVIYVNLPALIDLNTIKDPTVRALAEQILAGVNDKLSGAMTVEELKEALETALPYVEMIEGAGYEINLTSNTVSMLVAALNEMGKLDGVGTISLNVSIDKDIILKDAGTYLLAGVTADSNYTTVVNVGYAVITPDGYRAELGWNVEDENGIITLEALRKGYDLGASAVSVQEGNLEDATAHVHTVFFGVNKAGEMVLTQDQTALDIGAYTQLAFIADLGNTMYYAEPIMRAFIVAADIVNVQFIDGNGNINNERVFEYGDDASMKAQAFDRDGKVVTNGAMSYLYMGVQLNGEFYRGTDAPTRPGAYTVIAVFIGEDTMTVGAAAGTLVIKQITPDFTAEDKTVQYDGKEHNVAIQDNTGMSRIYVIMDEAGNVNVIVPAQLSGTAAVVSGSIAELFEKLETLELPSIPEMPEIPEELLNNYQDLVDAIRDAINELEKKYTIKNVTMNAPFPSEIGVYQVAVIGFKDIEHKIATNKATLTIVCQHTYDNACDPDCNICGENREVTKHNETYIDRYESTCVKHGYEKIRCKACDEVLSETELPLSEEHVYRDGVCLLCGAKEHREHNYVIVKELAPTCAEAGYVWMECSECGAEKNHEVGEPTDEHGDTYIDRYESTCVKHGYEKIRCKVCDEVLSEVELPLSEEHVYRNGVCLLCGAKEHREHNYVVVKELAPTCIEAGYVWMECSECGAEKNYEVGKPTGEHGDTYIDRYESTCAKAGYERIRCKICHEILSEVSLPLSTEHVYRNGICLLCGAKEACKHDYVTVKELAPTCGEVGYVWKECSKCGAEKNYEVGEPTGEHTFDNACDYECNICQYLRKVEPHKYQGSETTAPTCSKVGVMTYVCPECQDTYTEDIPATGEHIYANDCDADCDVCGDERVPAEHQYVGKVSLEPTCIDDGAMTYTCSECGDQYTEDIPATGDHVYDNACDATCNECSSERETDGHQYDVTQSSAPTCGADGVTTYTCSECGDTYTEFFPATREHVYDNACDDICNNCDEPRDVEDHVYDDEYDKDCNECGHVRLVPEEPNDCEHEYDNNCDNTCNKCAEERLVSDHVYDNSCDSTCNECGVEREVGEHIYNNACDPDCNECGESRTPADHVYDDEYDVECNECGAIREVPEKPAEPEECVHEYDNDCDSDCNLCQDTREVPDHVYDNACDTTCNVCGNVRVVDEHVYDDEYDVDCNECGETREVSERPTEPSEPTEPEEPDDDKTDVEEIPKTEDTSHISLWFTLMVCAVAALAFVLTNRDSFLYTGKYSK